MAVYSYAEVFERELAQKYARELISNELTLGKGVAMRADVYAQLCQTGLCCRLAR